VFFTVQHVLATEADRPRIKTNEQYIEDVLSPAVLPLDNPRAMFAAIFATLRERVKVFPTENYYYFSFFWNGVRYAGNIRLAANDRDAGKLHFVYFEDYAEWRSEPRVTHVVFDKSDGVTVERAARLMYRVSFQDKTVIFELNDLSNVTPATGSIAQDEKYIGPIFDESAIRFFLVFNTNLKLFHYILDETVKPADELIAAKKTDRILVGKRTGFAYYRDHLLERKILIGVFDANVRINNYLDGPFDQLPDNFIEGDTLRQSIVEADPGVAGKIDRFGWFADGMTRYLISPYLDYQQESELLKIHNCATRNHAKRNYYRCFNTRDAANKSSLRQK
jgi:hypothetical protein